MTKAQRPLRLIFQAGMMKRTVKILLLLALSTLLSGCNTTRGVGEDIQDLGHIISHAAS
jgi:entericidin A